MKAYDRERVKKALSVHFEEKSQTHIFLPAQSQLLVLGPTFMAMHKCKRVPLCTALELLYSVESVDGCGPYAQCVYDSLVAGN